MKYITFTALIKDGGYEKVHISPELFGQLALAIHEKGSESIQLTNRKIEVVGILKASKEAGERVMIIGGDSY
jgi:hypothetical protein